LDGEEMRETVRAQRVGMCWVAAVLARMVDMVRREGRVGLVPVDDLVQVRKVMGQVAGVSETARGLLGGYARVLYLAERVPGMSHSEVAPCLRRCIFLTAIVNSPAALQSLRREIKNMSSLWESTLSTYTCITMPFSTARYPPPPSKRNYSSPPYPSLLLLLLLLHPSHPPPQTATDSQDSDSDLYSLPSQAEESPSD